VDPAATDLKGDRNQTSEKVLNNKGEPVTKVFTCNLCPATYWEKNKLIRHLKIKHFHDHFECIECHHHFAEKYILRNHLTAVHKYIICEECKYPHNPTETHICTPE
jgi:transcription elongation factor Elf1